MSFGFQAGASSTDVILVFKNRESVQRVLKGQVTLGAGASVAAGPVGRSAEAATDVQMEAEIYSYSRSRGVFAGIALEGATIDVDDAANDLFYGREGLRARTSWPARRAPRRSRRGGWWRPSPPSRSETRLVRETPRRRHARLSPR